MVIPFDQSRLQRLHIVAAHKGFCYFQHAGNLKRTRRGRCLFRLRAVMLRFSRHLFRRAGGLFLFGLHAIRRGFLVLLDGRGLLFGNLFPRARGFAFRILLRRALVRACGFSLFTHA